MGVPDVENSYVPEAAGVNSNQRGAQELPGKQEEGGSLTLKTAPSLLARTVEGKGPAPGITIGVAQSSAGSGTVIVTEALARVPRPSRAVRFTVWTPGRVKECERL